MTPAEYYQLKAFARVDGAALALLWIASFACYVRSMVTPSLGVLSILLALFTPILLVRRLRRFRDYGREGVISFLRAWVYGILMFFYAGLLFALVQYVYLAFLDHGFLLEHFQRIMSDPENVRMVSQMGLESTMRESLAQMEQMRPIDLALNVLASNIMIGVAVSMPVAAAMARKVRP